MADTGEDRTEAATSRRLQQAREQGNIPLSREAAPAAMLAAATLMLMLRLPGAARELGHTLAALLGRSDAIDPLAGLRLALWAAAKVALPFALAGVCVSERSAPFFSAGDTAP